MYNISTKDINSIDSKIEFQKEYIKKFVSNFEDDNSDFLKSVYSASLNPKKYFAEINNRVNTLVSNAKEKGYKPVFVTLTLPSFYHRKKEDGSLIVSPNESSKALSHVWAKFLRLKIFEHLKNDFGEYMQYFRVYEPHISSVPHLHAILFLPAKYILKVKKRFYNYFMDLKTWGKREDTKENIGASNIGGLGFRYTWYKEKGGAVGYIMKYVLKTFKNEDSEKIQHAVYWYVKHRVIRFLSSRSLVPLSVYRKVRYYFKDHFGINSLKQISRLFKDGHIQRYFNNNLITFRYFCLDIDDYIELILWEKDPELVLIRSSEQKLNQETILKQITEKKNALREKKQIKLIIKIDDIEYFTNDNGELIKLNKTKPVNYRTSQDLYKSFVHMTNGNIRDYDDNHYILVYNELVKRKFVDGKIIKLESCRF
jgi:hypothetical protein